MNRFTRILGLTVVIVIAAGCGASDIPRTQVKGKVTVGGKGPLTGGNITFALASDTTKNGGGVIRPDGTYEVLNAPIGDCKVIIANKFLDSAAANKGMPGPGGMAGGSKPKDVDSKMSGGPKDAPIIGGGPTGSPKYMKISEDFSTGERTPLKSTVARGGATPSDFDVK